MVIFKIILEVFLTTEQKFRNLVSQPSLEYGMGAGPKRKAEIIESLTDMVQCSTLSNVVYADKISR